MNRNVEVEDFQSTIGDRGMGPLMSLHKRMCWKREGEEDTTRSTIGDGDDALRERRGKGKRKVHKQHKAVLNKGNEEWYSTTGDRIAGKTAIQD